MPYFGQELFLRAQEKGPSTTPAYLEALAKNRRLARTEGIDAVMDEHRLDALVAPTGGPAWMTDLVNGDHFTGGSSTAPAVAGYPNINVPARLRLRPARGTSFIGRAWSEPALLQHRLRVRAGHAASQAPEVPAHRRPARVTNFSAALDAGEARQ